MLQIDTLVSRDASLGGVWLTLALLASHRLQPRTQPIHSNRRPNALVPPSSLALFPSSSFPYLLSPEVLHFSLLENRKTKSHFIRVKMLSNVLAIALVGMGGMTGVLAQTESTAPILDGLQILSPGGPDVWWGASVNSAAITFNIALHLLSSASGLV